MGQTARGQTARLIGLALLTATASIAISASASATPLSYTFDSNNQGWMVTQDNGQHISSAAFQSTGGNPGGHLTVTDTGAETGCQSAGICNLIYFYSPFVSTMGANYGGTASFDLRSRDVDPAFGAELLLLPPGSNYLDGLIPEAAGKTYHHLSISLADTARNGSDPAWAICPYLGGNCTPPTQQQFKDLIAASDELAVMADVGPDGTGENYDLDNVTLTDGPLPPVVVPPAHKCKKKHKKRAAAAKKKCKRKRKPRGTGFRG